MLPIMRGIVRRTTCGAPFRGFVRMLELCGDGRRDLLRVLTYHRVDEPDAQPHLYPGTLSATPNDFMRQMEVVAERYHVLSINDILDACDRNSRLPARSVLITFDDAYRDFADHAWPVLKRLGLPVTLFVPTAYPDRPRYRFWWDRLYDAVCNSDEAIELDLLNGACSADSHEEKQRLFTKLKGHIRTLPHAEAMELVDRVCVTLGERQVTNHVLGWGELRRLASDGVTLAPHTRTHPLMNRISPEEAMREAVGSLTDLCDRIGDVPPVLAYPAGGVDPLAAEVLAAAGFKLAFTTRRGMNAMALANPLRLRRINVGRGTNVAMLRLQLLPQARYLNPCWNGKVFR